MWTVVSTLLSLLAFNWTFDVIFWLGFLGSWKWWSSLICLTEICCSLSIFSVGCVLFGPQQIGNADLDDKGGIDASQIDLEWEKLHIFMSLAIKDWYVGFQRFELKISSSFLGYSPLPSSQAFFRFVDQKGIPFFFSI
jgi:hypothetical protein